jgi:hypothetical protein
MGWTRRKYRRNQYKSVEIMMSRFGSVRLSA